MAGFNGRDLTINWDSVTLVGVRSKEYTITADLVDVTNDDDDGYRRTLPKAGMLACDVSVSGITSDAISIAAIMSLTNGETVRINLPTGTGRYIEGEFRVASTSGSGEHDGAYEFSTEYQSSGEFTYTAGT